MRNHIEYLYKLLNRLEKIEWDMNDCIILSMGNKDEPIEIDLLHTYETFQLASIGRNNINEYDGLFKLSYKRLVEYNRTQTYMNRRFSV